MIYEKMLEKSNLLEKEILKAIRELKNCPPGKLSCAKNGNGIKWYDCATVPPTYIPKKNQHLAEQLAKRKYLELMIKEFRKEKHAIDLYLKHCIKGSYKHQHLLSANGFESLLSPYFLSDDKKINEWLNEPYPANPLHPEGLIHNIGLGRKVRSKSEMMIAQALTAHGIPFRYECALQLGTSTYYPDFTILRPYDWRIVYWEHFGMMNASDYRQNTYSKLKSYNEHGIFQDFNLITTYETHLNSLDYNTILKKIELYLM